MRVVLVRGGKEWTPGLQQWIDVLRNILRGTTEVSTKSGRQVAIGLPSDTGAVVFVTRGMLDIAHNVKRQYPDLKVIVLTACRRDDNNGIIFIDKDRFDAEVFLNILRLST